MIKTVLFGMVSLLAFVAITTIKSGKSVFDK